MQTYLRKMKVTGVEYPYPGASGIQFVIEHPEGTVYAVYRDYPWPLDVLGRIPFDKASDGVFTFRHRDWWVYTNEIHTFTHPDRALLAAYTLARSEVDLCGVPVPIDLAAPLSIEAARKIMQAYGSSGGE